MNIKEIINKNIDLSEETKKEKIKLMNRIGELFNYKIGTINLEEIANNFEKTKNILITSIETNLKTKKTILEYLGMIKLYLKIIGKNTNVNTDNLSNLKIIIKNIESNETDEKIIYKYLYTNHKLSIDYRLYALYNYYNIFNYKIFVKDFFNTTYIKSPTYINFNETTIYFSPDNKDGIELKKDFVYDLISILLNIEIDEDLTKLLLNPNELIKKIDSLKHKNKKITTITNDDANISKFIKAFSRKKLSAEKKLNKPIKK